MQYFDSVQAEQKHLESSKKKKASIWEWTDNELKKKKEYELNDRKQVLNTGSQPLERVMSLASFKEVSKESNRGILLKMKGRREWNQNAPQLGDGS